MKSLPVRPALIALLGLLLPAAAFAMVPVPAIDLNPAAWRDLTAANQTLQMWNFFGPETAAVHDDDFHNPNGTPSGTVTGGTWTEWVDWTADEQRPGVWTMGKFSATIPNTPDLNPEKDIWVQVVYRMLEGGELDVSATATPNDSMESRLLATLDLGGGWFHSTWEVKLFPNPTSETVSIVGNDKVMIDGVVIETQCIPEPSTYALIFGAVAIAGVAVRRRMR